MSDPRVVQVVRMSLALKEQLDAYAVAHNMSVSDCIRHAVAAYVGADERALLHGNSKYTTQEEKRAAKRKQRAESRKRLALIKQLQGNNA